MNQRSGGAGRFPMNAQLIMRLAAVMLLMQTGGCASVRSRWSFGTQLPAAVHTSNHPHRQSPPTTAGEEPAKEDRDTNHASALREEPATASVPAKTTNVTLEDSDADHMRARAL